MINLEQLEKAGYDKYSDIYDIAKTISKSSYSEFVEIKVYDKIVGFIAETEIGSVKLKYFSERINGFERILYSYRKIDGSDKELIDVMDNSLVVKLFMADLFIKRVELITE